MAHDQFEDFQVGEVFRSYARTITESDLVTFTNFAGLKLPLFIDEEFARTQTPYGGRIAPGLLTASIAAGMMESVLGPYTLAALGLDKFRFSVPVRPGDTLRAEITVDAKRDTSDGERGVLSITTRVTNQKAELALQFQTTLLMRKGKV